MRRDAKISDILKPMEQCPTQAYISNALQVADVLEWLLKSDSVNKKNQRFIRPHSQYPRSFCGAHTSSAGSSRRDSLS